MSRTKGRSSALSFDSGPPMNALSPRNYAFKDSGAGFGADQPISNGPTFLSRNKTERGRLQGLVHVMSDMKERTKVEMGWPERIKVWMVNEGSRRIIMVVWLLLHLIAFGLAMTHYELKDSFVTARSTFNYTYVIARGAAQVLHIAQNDAKPLQRGVVGFLKYNFITGPGATGWVMTVALGIMVYFALEKKRRAHFERFWYSHHLFLVFFGSWQAHGMFCMIQPDRPPFCSAGTIGVFWKYWLPGGVVWISERILREVRARHVTYISKVIQHPSKVLEVQIKKEHTTRRAGQYIFINCPEISYFQYHPFTLTSAPEEDYISVHIRCAGDWTTAFAKALGADFDAKPKMDDFGGTVIAPPVGRVLPRVMVDGPFGSASEDFTKFETVLLVGAGIGVTPFASILKSIWYRMNNFGTEKKKTRLSKVYFVWASSLEETTDRLLLPVAAEWFHSLLQAVEAEDVDNRIEIHIYLTAKIDEDKMNNILVQDVGGEKDAITKLRAPTHFGRPNWDKVFEGIANKHPDTDCGVFFCGPAVLSRSLHQMSNKYTSPMGCRFFFGKEVGPAIQTVGMLTSCQKESQAGAWLGLQTSTVKVPFPIYLDPHHLISSHVNLTRLPPSTLLEMLPQPNTSRKTRNFFPSQTYNAHPSSSSQLLTHLRSRTRLTNLAVFLLISGLSLSVILNLHVYVLSSPSAPSFNARGTGTLSQSGWDDLASLSQIEGYTPLSIETTIERDHRMKDIDHLVLVPGHAIWTGHDASLVEDNDEWILENMQKHGSVKTFVRHIEAGVEVLKADIKSLLVFSGGATRQPPSPPLPESLSYHALATALLLLPRHPLPPIISDPEAGVPPYAPLPLNLRATTEEHALDSYENLLFSLARFKEVTGRYPTKLTVVGYGMKRRRFEMLHRQAIGFPLSQFKYIGIDDEGDTTEHYAGELKYGFTPFLHSPSGCHPPLSTKRILRNPYARYHPYHASNPELVELFEWCPPLSEASLDEQGSLVGYEGYPGSVPWRNGTDGEVMWDRERD
ncbi:hypothetical protein P7C73_g4778, partial [Tremellales sp. Uapishka_1]